MRKGYVDECHRVSNYARCFFVMCLMCTFLYFSLDYVFVRHIWIWQLKTNYNKLK
jgi:hypothetical protein